VLHKGLELLYIYMSYQSYTGGRSYNFVNNFDEVITLIDKIDEVITLSYNSVEVITSTVMFNEVITSSIEFCRSYFRSSKYQITEDI
jgi:hypothetical protein